MNPTAENPFDGIIASAPKQLLLVTTVALSMLGNSPAAFGSENQLAITRSPIGAAGIANPARRSIERAIERFFGFEKLPADWDDAGARAPDSAAISAAIDFLTHLQPWHPRPMATLDSDGSPVIELEDADVDLFGSITFLSPTRVELYARRGGTSTSRHLEADLASAEARSFLAGELLIPQT